MQHIGPISGLACYGGRYVASAGYDNQVILWDGLTRRALQRSYHDHLANQCAFSPDGRHLATASSDYTARLWDVPSLRLRTVFDGHADDIEMVAFSPCSTRLATCSRDRMISVFALDGRLLTRMTGHQADVISVSWLANGSEILSSSDDGTVRRWSATTGRELERVSLGGVETDTIAIASDDLIFAGDDEGAIHILSAGSKRSITAHRAGVKRLVYDALSRRLVSLSYDRKMCVWSLQDAELKKQAEAALPDIVWPRSCAFYDAGRLVFATFGSSYAIYDLAAQEWDVADITPGISVNAVLEDEGRVLTIGDAGVLKRDGQTIGGPRSLCNFLGQLGPVTLTGGQTGAVFDAVTGETIAQHRSPLNCCTAFLRDGKPCAAIGSYTGELLFLQLDGRRAAHVDTVKVHANAIKGVSSDGAVLFTVCADRSVAWTDIRTLEVRKLIPDAHDRIANGCAAISSGIFASVSRDLQLRIWDGFDAEVIKTPHANSIKCIASDGRYVASGNYAGTMAIYDLVTRRFVAEGKLTAAGLSSVTAVAAEDAFIFGSYDGAVYRVRVGENASQRAA